MATSISKSVPRSRLNITYRTRIDGQVVPKELPLRLLIAGDFSGRGKVQPPARAKPMAPLSQRVIYSIGKDSTLEGVLSRARVSLPIPSNLRTDRSLALLGQATVRVEKAKKADKSVGYLLTIKSSLIEQAVELVATDSDPSVVANDTKLYSGEVLALGSFEIEKLDLVATPLKMPSDPTSAAPSVSTDEAIKKWQLGRAGLSKAVNSGVVWKSTVGVEVCGNVTAPVSPAGEPPSLLEVVGKTTVYFHFEDDFVASLSPDSPDAVEFRVRLVIPKATAHRGIQVANMASFSPERVAMSVPSIRRLLVVRWLLSQGRSLIGSNPALRAQVKDMLSLEEARLKARQDIATKFKDAYDKNLAAGKALCTDPWVAPADPIDEPLYGKPLLDLVSKASLTDDEKKKVVELRAAVKTEWWAAKATIDKQKDQGTEDQKKAAADLQTALLKPSPWDELLEAIQPLGAKHFKIEGDLK